MTDKQKAHARNVYHLLLVTGKGLKKAREEARKKERKNELE